MNYDKLKRFADEECKSCNGEGVVMLADGEEIACVCAMTNIGEYEGEMYEGEMSMETARDNQD